ncbi:hypothetical protein CVT24_006875 [Panaeolus cyanescens]|uniref:DUF6589 domain-containing protein n=1 Tax=Panaeolus cyanescens TaxID=181874 RepID=A0A409YX05_9AGAR|nr:hypothetical protein CVT24_006875 [Panaeolus cyanescens]
MPTNKPRIILSGLHFNTTDSDDEDIEDIALSSPDRVHQSSPTLSSLDEYQNLSFNELHDLPEDGNLSDTSYYPVSTPTPRAPALTDIKKAAMVLDYMHSNFSHFSLFIFLHTLFHNSLSEAGTTTQPMETDSKVSKSNTPQAKVKKSANMFLSEGRHLDLMEYWWDKEGGSTHGRNARMQKWVISKAEVLCAKEASYITDWAWNGSCRKKLHELACFASCIPEITDLAAIPPTKTEEYYLPTFDQEQGSTRENMIVLKHYFQKVLKMLPEAFEKSMVLVLGDRLTTAQDWAAQDQQAVD